MPDGAVSTRTAPAASATPPAAKPTVDRRPSVFALSLASLVPAALLAPATFGPARFLLPFLGLGLMSLGSAIGGIAYGGRTWHAPLARQFSVALAIVGAGLAILAIDWTPWPFAALCVLAGVAIAPGLIVQSMLTARMARPEHATEAFTWTTSALLAGVGIGLAAGGALLEVFTSRAAFAGGAIASLEAGRQGETGETGETGEAGKVRSSDDDGDERHG